MMRWERDAGRAVADFHTLFNLALAALFLPLLGVCATGMRRLLPARIDPADPSRPLHLHDSARETPAIALGGAAREALRLADVLEVMLGGLRDALARGERTRIAETRRLDDVLDRLNGAIKAYLTALDPDAMSDADRRRMSEILAFTTNLEHAGDVVERNLLGMAAKKTRRGVAFPAGVQDDLLALIDRLVTDLRIAASLLVTGDVRAARQLAAEKEVFRDIEAQATANHFERLRDARGDAAEASGLHLDLIRDLKRVGSHLVAAAAYPVLEATGDLLPSRLRPADSGWGEDSTS